MSNHAFAFLLLEYEQVVNGVGGIELKTSRNAGKGRDENGPWIHSKNKSTQKQPCRRISLLCMVHIYNGYLEEMPRFAKMPGLEM